VLHGFTDRLQKQTEELERSRQVVDAEREAEARAQYEILRIVQKLDPRGARDVIRAVQHLLEADSLVPNAGLLDSVLREKLCSGSE
jgi:hypothetical protein